MNTREQLNSYLRALETRLRWMTVSKGIAVAAGVALGATLALVLITNALAFSSTSLMVARFVLFVALAAALGFALLIPLLRLNRRRTARRAEAVFPQFEERLLTYVERSDSRDPMLELLAADTQSVAQKTKPEHVAPRKSIFAFATGAGAAGAVLLWLILAGPGFLGYGANLLWAGVPKTGAGVPYYDIEVNPGNKLVRRRDDQMITATLSGFQAPQVRLFARYKSSSKWEAANMLPRASGSAYEFLFAAIPEPVEYYVEAAGVRSKTFKLDVADLPAITKLKVTYHFPSWLGIPDKTEDPGGDLRAVSGTVAELTVQTDRPLKNGAIELDDGTHISLDQGAGGTLTAKVPVQKDGNYHFAALDQGQSVRLSEDYFIEAQDDQAPNVKITHPGGDARVSPIEEVTVNVQADDDFALQGMELHYSVNGGDEKTVNLLPNKGVKSAEGKTLIALEDYNLQPGDVVSMYASAKDARTTSRTDMMFIDAQPYERNYSQSQQAGGGGGGGGGMQDQQEISRRQKEIIAATFNAIRSGPKDRAATPENAQYLSDTQNTLKGQATSLANRVTARELAGANQEFANFTKEMQAAAAEMGPASDKLKGLKWKDALGPEERALQHLERAEATMRDIQVAFGRNGGGGGGGASAGRDLANLFDLELDTEKNQYEQQQQQSTAEERQKQIDNALQKLDELARRQQELAQQQRNSKQQTLDQRWQQEQLRREAEELQKQIQQLQQQQQQSGGQLSRNGQSSSSQSGQSGQQSGRLGNASQQQLQQALDRLKQATDDMRAAQKASQENGQQNSDQAQAEARRAAERLQEARDMVNSMRRQDASSKLGDLSDRADRLANEQHDVENRMKQAFGDRFSQDPRQRMPQAGATRQTAEQLAGEKEKMAQELDQLEKDVRQAARELATTQPNASARLRDGLSEVQQNDTQRRMQQAAGWIRQGQGPLITSREAPVTQGLDGLRDQIHQAQQAMTNGNQQQAARGDVERQLQQIESLRNQLQNLAGRGQQNGQNGKNGQNGSQQQGQNGGQAGQGGQQAQAGGQRGGGGPYGGGRNYGRFNPNGGGFYGGSYDPRLGPGRQNPEGIYEVPDENNVQPAEQGREIQRQLQELREAYKDDPDVSRQIGDLQKEVQNLQFGATASPELAQRINRVILPQLETIDIQLRQDLEANGSGQARTAATDQVPPGYGDSVADYFRRLSKGK